jgi:hypothetical protein
MTGIRIKVSSNDFEAARQILAWLAYPDRPHLRTRESDQSSMRGKAENWMNQYLIRLKGDVPRTRNGRIVERVRTNENMYKLDVNIKRALWSAALFDQPGKISIQSNGDFAKNADGSMTFRASSPFNYFANVGEYVARRRALAQPNTAEKVQQRTARETYFEAYKPVLHLAWGLARQWPRMMKYDPIHGDKFERENRPLARLLLFPDWIDEVLAVAENWKNMPASAGYAGRPIEFWREHIFS